MYEFIVKLFPVIKNGWEKATVFSMDWPEDGEVGYAEGTEKAGGGFRATAGAGA